MGALEADGAPPLWAKKIDMSPLSEIFIIKFFNILIFHCSTPCKLFHAICLFSAKFTISFGVEIGYS